MPDRVESSGTVSVAPKISTILVANTAKEDHVLIRTSQLLQVRKNSIAEDGNVSNLDYTLFIQILEKEVGFEGSRSGIYYYIKTLDG
jgi:hypothetical protein